MQLRTLGKLELSSSSFSRPKPLLLLTYLSLEGSKGRADLAELFYMDAKNPMSSLRVALKQLRESTNDSLRIDDRRVEVALTSDAIELLMASEAGRHEEVIKYYKGIFLDGYKLKDITVELENWIYETRDFITANVRQAYLALAQSKAQQNAFNEAAEFAQQAFRLGTNDLDPSKLDQIYSLMLLADKPNTSELKRLAAEYGIDLSSSAEQAKANFKPSQQGTPSNVSERGNSFVGRSKELKVIGDLLENPDCRLLSLQGQGGTGKTRLATHLALQYLATESFNDGIYIVHLDALSDAKQIPGAIAQTLDISLKQNDISQQIISFINSKNILVILDNFEHVIAGASICSDLVSNCPNLTLVVTSREALNIEEEYSLEITGLSRPASLTLSLEEAQTFPSLKLFEDRVKRSKLNYQLNLEDLPHLINIITFVEGLPLGIELAAASTSVMVISEIASELQRNLDTLYSNARDVSTRHQSLRATFEYSWNLLNTKEQCILKQLSICVGGFTRQAASAIVNADIPTLSSLVDKSLIKLSETGRFERHMLIYQYTHELFQVDLQQAAVEAKHATYYTNLALEAEPQLIGKKQLEWLNALELEHDNMRVALNWNLRNEPERALRQATALRRFWEIRGYFSEGLGWLKTSVEGAEARETEIYLKAIYALAALLNTQHDVEMAQAYLSECSYLAKQLKNTQVLADTLNLQAGIAWAGGNLAESRNLLSQSLELKREIGDKRGVAISLENLGILAKRQRNYDLAVTLYEESYAIYLRLSDTSRSANALRNIGRAYFLQGDFSQAKQVLQKSLLSFREVNDKRKEGQTLNDLACIACHDNDFDVALKYLKTSHEIAKIQDVKRDCLNVILGFGLVAYAKENYYEAYSHFKQILQNANALEATASALEGLASIFCKQQNYSLAAAIWGALENLNQDASLIKIFLEASYNKDIDEAKSFLGESIYTLHFKHGGNLQLEELISLTQTPDLYTSIIDI